MRLGVCYYPEHWKEEIWPKDAKRMKSLGIELVRIGEFAWSRIEPQPGSFDWSWLDRAIDTLQSEGLKIIMCTPTATPPKWLVDKMPQMLACDETGGPRKFGSRRHYCFSSPDYRKECRRIVRCLAERYGAHPAIVMWQTDNEYGCHDTVESYSTAALLGFRSWLKTRYGTIAALNTAWGTVFWSQEYGAFEEIEFPAQTVTEANPSHRLDFQRYSSDQVASFNSDQVEILRRHAPGREITHNFMGTFTAFDHYKTGADLDIATWDSYPLGFLDQSTSTETEKQTWLRQGHPDFQAFHHDLYRGCAAKWGVMEQQPGPVNWAPYNPAPLPGMVRLWSLEAIAHGADLVSWFRWRQAPFAQEQMHAGLLTPDNEPAPAFEEAAQVSEDLKVIGKPDIAGADVALIFDYEGQWIHQIQPQGKHFDLWTQTFETYCALRALGLDVDILPQNADLSVYKLIVVPGVPVLSRQLLKTVKTCSAHTVFLPRSGSKTENFQIPPGLPPAGLQSELGLKVARVESLRPGTEHTADLQGEILTIVNWKEHVDLLAPTSGDTPHVRAQFEDGTPFWVQKDGLIYLAGWPDKSSAKQVFKAVAAQVGLITVDLGEHLRLRRLGALTFAFNYGPTPTPLDGALDAEASLILGEKTLPAAGVAIWRSEGQAPI